jgi:hypothetical protein
MPERLGKYEILERLGKAPWASSTTPTIRSSTATSLSR